MKKNVNPKKKTVNVVALVPARGGQQTIKYKNLRKMGNKSLLAWAVDVAFASKNIDAVVVSTEDKKIAREAEKLGAIVAPRPAEFSQPTSGDAGFYHHAVTWMEEELGWTPELIVNLRPTSPIRFPEDIDAMINYMKKSGADGMKSVIPAQDHPYKTWQFVGAKNLEVGKAGAMIPILDNEYRRIHGPDQPRQRIQPMFPYFFQDGQVDITRRKFVLRPEALANENIFGENIHGYVLDPHTSTDVDTPEDLRHAEKIYKMLLRERKGKKK